MAPDPWLATYDVTCHLAQDIAEKIHERNRCQRRGENPAKVNMALRTLLQNLKEKIEYLKDSLLRAVSTRQITQLEGDRRQNLVDDLLTREKQLQASYKNEGTEPDLIRSSLMTGKCHHGVSNPWLLEEPEETRGLGFGEIRQQQQRIIAEQDAGLDALSSVLSRQKQMGQDIGNELDEQNASSSAQIAVATYYEPGLMLLPSLTTSSEISGFQHRASRSCKSLMTSPTWWKIQMTKSAPRPEE
ncbi:syntaxin-8 isoform X3 [Rhinatrema bivittatum]|uniref:syntaxin-8 isoform X3 n=1 Tax=Rhinatrema bivittatum TaxID=194408 RepID=UPI00112971D1|nr:syntaxin-8 isoform X3 [Rhinatrema bivittatum]